MSATKNKQQATEASDSKKGLKKSAKITLLVLSILFFLAAIITPIVVFATPRDDGGVQEEIVGDFVLRYDASAGCYDIVRYIGDDKEVTVPATINEKPIRNILKDAFNAEDRASNRNITSITIEEGVSSIGVNAFKGCEGITEIVLPESMISVGERAFEDSGLTKISVKDATTLKFAEDALAGADSLTVLSILGASEQLTSGSLDNISGTITDVELGSGVEVSDGAFDGLDSVTTLSVYNYSNLVVSQDAFNNSNIETLNIYWAEDVLTEDFMEKFSSLTKLTTVNLDSRINKINPRALSMFNTLSSLTMGDGTVIDVSSLPNLSSDVLKVYMSYHENIF